MLPVTDVPTTLVTGFLGVGKTTAIRRLLAGNTGGERWAVLVNEFGEIGIDGALLADGEVAVHEIPGGCICCTSGVAMQVGLVRLLREVRPDRVLIEPTGLAHPASVLDLLRRPGLAEAVTVRATLTLVDPRHLGDDRIRANRTWQDQVTVADVLVATKTDLCTPTDLRAFRRFAQERWPPAVAVAEVAHGALDPAWLDLDPRPQQTTRFTPASLPHLLDPTRAAEPPTPTSGWIWPPELRFDRRVLRDVLQTMVRPGPVMPRGVLRLKGLFRTPGAWLAVQADPDAVRFEPVGWRRDSRVEVIAPPGEPPDWDAVQAHLERAIH